MADEEVLLQDFTKCKFCSRPVRPARRFISIVCSDACAQLVTDLNERKRERAYYGDDEHKPDRS